ncbi:DUF5318 family protein [Nonomuraea roseoviolacea]|uniref:DUF5318 family protein n=1 Tax=Nonomuraea roseoviolacea TaxID=103837 RepID=UPI0031D2E6BB
MWSQRRVVDDGLSARGVVRDPRSPGEVCDAQPFLLHAARYLGEPTERLCPVCGRRNVTNVTYVDGDRLGRHTGQAKATSDLVEMDHDDDEIRVYVVEVCQGCSRNHMTVSLVLGNGPPDLVGRE